MRLIGHVKLVQVQQASLKVGEKPDRRYDPAPLCVVDSLELSADGVTGVNWDGGRIVDVHHAIHPQTKNNAGTNPISLGFTSHYRAMRERFGEHLTDGSAGENILIACERAITLADLGRQVVIQSASGEQVRLDVLSDAPPCEPFSQFAAGSRIAGGELKAALQFLQAGMRGYYVALTPGQSAPTVQAGDSVYCA